MMSRFVIVLFLCLNAFSNEGETIPWSETKKLAWTDFKGPIEADSDAAAVTASGITFSYAIRKTDDRITDFEAQAEAHFYTENSWFIKDRCNDHILAHEQLHFDITELHVRIFRYRLERLEISQHIKSELNKLHETVNRELAEMQHNYDTESQNSINKEEQIKWNAYVAENLKKFEAFKSE
ncbi:DUF922 domain-containing protein [Psychroserpens mesophilus]|uniref:DUF922 domain-containing protein n=1 Tax=Psychroserpens mesophilus TaxID=325473 RepID=UPI003F492AE5